MTSGLFFPSLPLFSTMFKCQLCNIVLSTKGKKDVHLREKCTRKPFTKNIVGAGNITLSRSANREFLCFQQNGQCTITCVTYSGICKHIDSCPGPWKPQVVCIIPNIYKQH